MSYRRLKLHSLLVIVIVSLLGLGAGSCIIRTKRHPHGHAVKRSKHKKHKKHRKHKKRKKHKRHHRH